MPRMPRKKGEVVRLFRGEAKRWSPATALAKQVRVDRKAKELAKELGATGGILVVGFWPDPSDPTVWHHLTGGQSPWPPSFVFRRLAEQFGNRFIDEPE